jgi:hypothetical protein
MVSPLPPARGFLYLAVVLDAWSRRIVGWASSAWTIERIREDAPGPSTRLPASRSACFTQVEIDCAVGSNSRASSSGVRPDMALVARKLDNVVHHSDSQLTLTAMDRLVGWHRKATRRGLTHTPIDQTCLSPDLSAAQDALRWGFASPMPVTREGPDLAWSRDCPVHAFGPGEAVHARSELQAGNGCHRRNRASHRRRRGYAQRSACRGVRGRTGSRSGNS